MKFSLRSPATSPPSATVVATLGPGIGVGIDLRSGRAGHRPAARGLQPDPPEHAPGLRSRRGPRPDRSGRAVHLRGHLRAPDESLTEGCTHDHRQLRSSRRRRGATRSCRTPTSSSSASSPSSSSSSSSARCSSRVSRRRWRSAPRRSRAASSGPRRLRPRRSGRCEEYRASSPRPGTRRPGSARRRRREGAQIKAELREEAQAEARRIIEAAQAQIEADRQAGVHPAPRARSAVCPSSWPAASSASPSRTRRGSAASSTGSSRSWRAPTRRRCGDDC